MRKFLSLLFMTGLIVVFVGCGARIPLEEHEIVVQERDYLQNEIYALSTTYDALQSEHETLSEEKTALQGEFEELSAASA